MKEYMKKERDYLFDNCKFLLIIFVVVGHFIDFDLSINSIYKSLFIFIYTIHMPLFIFICGVFYNDKNINEKVLSYLYLFVLQRLIIIILYQIFEIKYNFLLFGNDGWHWFIFALIIYNLVLFLCRKTKIKYLLVISLILSCISGYDNSIGDMFYLSRTIVFLPYYVAGVFVGKDRIIQLSKSKLVFYISLIVIIAYFLMCFKFIDKIYLFRPMFTGRNPFSKTQFRNFGWIGRGITHILSSVIGFAFLMVVPRCKFGIMSLFGQRTLQVYFWHILFREVLKLTGIRTIICSTQYGKVFWFIIPIVLTLILSLKCFAWPLNIFKYKNLLKEELI